MMLLFALLGTALELVDTVSLPEEFNSIGTDVNYVYLAPFAGTSLYRFSTPRRFDVIQFTDDANYRIKNFAVTPFAIYLNNGASIERYYTNSGVTNTIVTSPSVAAFTLSSTEEIVFANERAAEVSFLDFTFHVKYILRNIRVLDLSHDENKLYLLTGHSISIHDEYGNTLDTLSIPEFCTRVCCVGNLLLTFSPGKTYLYIRDTQWQRIELIQGIRDITGQKGNILILNNDGSTLSIYRTANP